MKLPHVTVCTPLAPHRMEEMHNAYANFNRQTYKRADLLICADAGTIGAKRNLLVSKAKGDIIVMMDSDDIYAADWIEKSVDWLRSHPEAAITGLSRMYYRADGVRYLWEYKGSQRYVTEGTMAFWKKWHGGAKVFGDNSSGEGHNFLRGNGKIVPHDYIDGFEGQITGKNTESHHSLYRMTLVEE